MTPTFTAREPFQNRRRTVSGPVAISTRSGNSNGGPTPTKRLDPRGDPPRGGSGGETEYDTLQPCDFVAETLRAYPSGLRRQPAITLGAHSNGASGPRGNGIGLSGQGPRGWPGLITGDAGDILGSSRNETMRGATMRNRTEFGRTRVPLRFALPGPLPRSLTPTPVRGRFSRSNLRPRVFLMVMGCSLVSRFKKNITKKFHTRDWQ